MMKSDSLVKRNLYILFALAIAAVAFAIVLLVLLSAFGFIGFDGNFQIAATCTAGTYYNTKYSQVVLLEEVSYIFAILCLAACVTVFVLLLKTVRNSTSMTDTEVFISKCAKITLYVLTSLAIMAAIPPFGYYLSMQVEINNCTAAYDSSKLAAVIAMAAVLLTLLLVIFVLLFLSFCSSSEEKYREVSSHHTEPNEKVEKAQEVQYRSKHKEKDEPYRREAEVYEKRTPQELEKNSPPKRVVANRADEFEHTKENLNSSPSRQPVIHTYSKEVDRPLLRPTPTEKSHEPAREPAPVLQHRSTTKQSYPGDSASKYGSPSRAPREDNGELMFHRRARGLAEDEADFSREQNRFLSKYADRPILSSGVKEVNSRGPGDGFHAGELPRTYGSNSPSVVRAGREGNLLNRIRGKYAH